MSVRIRLPVLYRWVCLAAKTADCKSVTRKHRGFESHPIYFTDMAEPEDAAGSNPAGEIRAGSNPAVSIHGDLAERLIASVLKTGGRETGPGVRIPQSPLLLTCANGKRAHC